MMQMMWMIRMKDLINHRKYAGHLQSCKVCTYAYIKTQIKARQKAFTKGDICEYRRLCAKVANLITNAKRRYYENKAKSVRFSNPRKWFKSIYTLYAAENDHLHQHMQRKCIQSQSRRNYFRTCLHFELLYL